MDIQQRAQLEDVILNLFKTESSLTTLKIVNYIRQRDSSIYESDIRQRVWALIDRDLMELTQDRKLRLNESHRYE